MGTMNESILADPRTFPAARAGEVNVGHIFAVAQAVAEQLVGVGYAAAVLEPGDSTRYEVVIVTVGHSGASFRVGSNFGVLYPWNGNPTIHPDYSTEHYVANRNPWTGTVLALFLNAVAEQLGVLGRGDG